MYNHTYANEHEIGNKISGFVERVTYHNPDSGFCVLKIKVSNDDQPVVITGNSPDISVGENIECTGKWVNDKIYGQQFKSDRLLITAPSTSEGTEKYLVATIKGIGEVSAKKLVGMFGPSVFEIIENYPELIGDLLQVPYDMAQRMQEELKSKKAIRAINLFFNSYGIGAAVAAKLCEKYGNDAINFVKNNPYILIKDIKGVGFLTADKIAANLGIIRDSMLRIQAGVNYVLSEARRDGNCGLPTTQVILNSTKLLELSEELIVSAINLECQLGRFVIENVREVECIFLENLASRETQIAKMLLNLQKGKNSWKHLNIDEAIDTTSNSSDIRLSSTQHEAIRCVLNSKVSVITGGPGVGKTTLVNFLAKTLGKQNISVKLAAPTGRAAKRLGTITGSKATTIHRLLKKTPGKESVEGEKLVCDLLIVDEVSMIDVTLMYAVLKALPPSASLLLIGDVDQLPSVGAGSVLSDIINSNVINIIRLTEIFRQTKESSIVITANMINQGLMPTLQGQQDLKFIECDTSKSVSDNIIRELAEELYLDRDYFRLMNNVQVLSPMKKGDIGTVALNTLLQKSCNPREESCNKDEIENGARVFRVHDKVMQTANNYEKDVFNGDIGFITLISSKDEKITVNFDGKEIIYKCNEIEEIVHAYAITIHKSQGSEYDTVVIPLMMQHYSMLQRNLIYTAITRAKNRVIIIGERQAFKRAISTASTKLRYTTLKHKLSRLHNSPVFI